MAHPITQTSQMETSDELLHEIFRRPVLPDESQETYDALRAVLLDDLKPKTSYATLLANQLVELEWDLLRHRRLREALLRAEFRHQCASALDSKNGHDFWALDTSEASKAIASDLTSVDPERQSSARTELAAHEIALTEIMAQAYQKRARDLDPHERQIAEIETRRRKLREDFDRINALPSLPIEDAEIVDP